ncbi:class I adenylate-forming enzyme family protein [Altererythrobacter lutimaris]|uniref:Acyl--CoA ligase n=1 Tax=Altererythrobacter lutimaris TaxID=2743979 RepID=A0A850H8T1_9SPHN|nr:class I adenylate-forming enzyme family protein [Altererythrobacter lutimaris]NVE93361.1 acyl--CoA ligase [Altererythrobacter lutimaris]
MSGLRGLLKRFKRYADRPALIEADGRVVTFTELVESVDAVRERLAEAGVAAGDVIALKADYDSASIANLLAALGHGAIVALLPVASEADTELLELCQASHLVEGEQIAALQGTKGEPHPQLETLRQTSTPGLVIFTSGTSGKPKAVLHDAERFLARFEDASKAHTTIGFLLFDHIAGLDTACYTLAAGGTLVALKDRRATTVREAIASTSAEVLPASPSFLRLLCLDEDAASDLQSLRTITYGSEPMDEATLERLEAMLPDAKLIQKFGTSEFGVVPARTKPDDKRFIELDERKVGIRIEDGMLHVRAPTAMIGYLGEETPSVVDGWIATGDSVEQDGQWIRIIGRQSELINVGGEKVYPAEIEDVIRELDEVREVIVRGDPHPLLGKVIAARIRTVEGADTAAVRKAVRKHCSARLARYKVPVTIELTQDALTGERQKLLRRS